MKKMNVFDEWIGKWVIVYMTAPVFTGQPCLMGRLQEVCSDGLVIQFVGNVVAMNMQHVQAVMLVKDQEVPTLEAMVQLTREHKR